MRSLGSVSIAALVAALLACEEPPATPPTPAPEAEAPREAQAEPRAVNPVLARANEDSTAALLEQLLARPPEQRGPRERYLDLMKLSLTDLLYENDQQGRRKRVEGWDWPSRAYTMIGVRRLNNVESCYDHVMAENVPGDFLEAGAWRGGATIFMRSLLAVDGVTDRRVWVADSFEGLPPPDTENFPADAGLDLSGAEMLAVSLEEVKRNFRRYGLLDDQVVFLKGWFKDTLPTAPIEQLAILRLDADLYESTMQAISFLYPKLSSGGCLIVDDYFIPACRQAIHDYRAEHDIREPLQRIDSMSVYWIKD